MKVLAAALLLTLSTGCAGAVAVPDPLPTGPAAEVCAAMMADLPATVLDQERREVEPGVSSAAWGRPAIVLRCGVPKPATLTVSSECLEVNGVGWFTEEADGGTIFTTIGRPAFVELSVPENYADPSGALVDLAAAVTAHNPVLTPCV